MDDIPQLVEELPADFSIQQSHLGVASGDAGSNGAELEPAQPAAKIPVTIVTGYLGSGKLTLLEQIARTSTRRLAVILNEFGNTADIEKAVTIHDELGPVQEWLDLGNGCLCCTVKDAGVLAIEQLVQRAPGRIDHVLLETTGVADPAPIAKMFWLDDALASSLYIDSVITVVDAGAIVACLDDTGGHWHSENAEGSGSAKEPDDLPPVLTAHLQLALADCILLNKIDTIDPADVLPIVERLRAVNAVAPVHETSFGSVSLDKILDLGAFDAAADKVVSLMALARNMSYHDDRLTTVDLEFPFFTAPDSFDKVEAFLQRVLWENRVQGRPVEVHRLKGIVACVQDGDAEIKVVQGVRDTYEILDNARLPALVTCNRLVFIGKDLDKAALETDLGVFLRGESDSEGDTEREN